MRRNEYPLKAEWDEPEKVTPWEFVKAAAVFFGLLVVGYLWLVTLAAAQS